MHADTHKEIPKHTQPLHLLMDVLKGKNTWFGWRAVSVCLFCVSVGGGVTALGNHTPSSSHQGTSVSLWFRHVTPPSSLPSCAAHCRNRSTTYNGGAMRSKYVHPSPCPSTPPCPSALPATRYCHHPANESKLWPSRGHSGAGWGETRTASHNMPPPSHNSHLPSHAWTERIPESHVEWAHSQYTFAPTKWIAHGCKIKWGGEIWKYLIMDIVGIVWNCLQWFITVTLLGSMRWMNRERWRFVKKTCLPGNPIDMGLSNNFTF